MGTQLGIPAYFTFVYRKCISWARGYTISAMVADTDSVWVMAIPALVITPLQEDNEPVARPVDAREIEDVTDCRSSAALAHGSQLVVCGLGFRYLLQLLHLALWYWFGNLVP